MSVHGHIKKTLEGLLQKHATRDPLELAKAEGIHLFPRHNFQELKGMFLIINDWPCLFYKADLPLRERWEVVAHELGHAFLHGDYLAAGKEFIEKNNFYDPRTKLEREANFFAAELLITDEAFFSALKEGGELQYVAAILGYHPHLVLFKAEFLSDQGHRLHLPYLAASDYLAR